MSKGTWALGPAVRAEPPELVHNALGADKVVRCGDGVRVVAGTHQSFLAVSGLAGLSLEVVSDPVVPLPPCFWLLL